MPRPNNVRDAQRRLAELDSEYRRSVAKLDRAIARRSEILIQHERRVAAQPGSHAGASSGKVQCEGRRQCPRRFWCDVRTSRRSRDLDRNSGAQ